MYPSHCHQRSCNVRSRFIAASDCCDDFDLVLPSPEVLPSSAEYSTRLSGAAVHGSGGILNPSGRPSVLTGAPSYISHEGYWKSSLSTPYSVVRIDKPKAYLVLNRMPTFSFFLMVANTMLATSKAFSFPAKTSIASSERTRVLLPGSRRFDVLRTGARH